MNSLLDGDAVLTHVRIEGKIACLVRASKFSSILLFIFPFSRLLFHRHEYLGERPPDRVAQDDDDLGVHLNYQAREKSILLPRATSTKRHP